jgi:hypothetical protein
MFYTLLIALILVPFGALAQPITPPTDFRSFLGILNGIINILVPLIFALTFLTITWGVIKAWIMGDASSDDVANGKNIAFVGVIALVIMTAIWGILRLLQAGIFG